MHIRQATPADSDAIRRIAEQSFQSSFALSPEEIATLVEERFSAEDIAARLDTERPFLVAETEVEGSETVGGFLDGTGTHRIRWLHVDPDARGQGLGTALVERLQEEREEANPVAWEVLDDAVEGTGFCDRFGYSEQGRDWLDVGGHEYPVTIYAEGERAEEPNEPAVRVPDSLRVDGEERPLDHDDRIPGRDAPFFRTYVSADRESPYGYFCSQCGGTDVTADGLDRLECGTCGNVHLADEWDGGYL